MTQERTEDNVQYGQPNNDIPLSEQIACVKRELAMRQRVYPRWVELGKMKSEMAMREMTRMEAVLRTLEDVAARENKQLELFQQGAGRWCGECTAEEVNSDPRTS